ncbi:hypothetical protein [Opitutus sp. ER46]|uniref:hypothetical protein n=1 Tax=Opitutus sp. ER46 TaxID=2161864 RepID=UPI0011B1DC60|nr:hypothetical protein [Opitutus sp. ER46]
MKRFIAVAAVAGLVVVGLVLVWRHSQPQSAAARPANPAVATPMGVTATRSPTAAPGRAVTAVATPSSAPAVPGVQVGASVSSGSALASMPAAQLGADEPPLEAATASAAVAPNGAVAANVDQSGRVHPRIDEVTATRRMIAAHAPLLDPKVADPDSAENRQVLQTMVQKALSRAEKK